MRGDRALAVVLAVVVALFALVVSAQPPACCVPAAAEWIFAAEPAGITGYVTDNGSGFAYRGVLGVGARLP